MKTITIDWKTYTLTPVEEDRNKVMAECGGLSPNYGCNSTTATEVHLRKDEKKLRYKVGDEVYVKNCYGIKDWRHNIADTRENRYFTVDWVWRFTEAFIDHDKTAQGKPKEVKSWEDLGEISGWYVDYDSRILGEAKDVKTEYNKRSCIRATKEQAECSIILAQLSQLMKYYNGDWEPDWTEITTCKYCLICNNDGISWTTERSISNFLAFPTEEIRDRFLENHRELIEKAKPLL